MFSHHCLSEGWTSSSSCCQIDRKLLTIYSNGCGVARVRRDRIGKGGWEGNEKFWGGVGVVWGVY